MSFNFAEKGIEYMEKIEKIIEDVKLYITVLFDEEEEVNDNLLSLLCNKSVDTVSQVRYGNGYTEEQKQTAIEQYESKIFDLTLYRYLKMGAEFEKQHSSNGTVISYQSESDILKGIVPLAKLI